MMANYFGVSKSDLVERYDENKPYYANPEITQFAQALQNSPYANNLITSITDLSEEEMAETLKYIDYLKSKRNT